MSSEADRYHGYATFMSSSVATDRFDPVTLVGRTLFGSPVRMLSGIWISNLPRAQARRFWAAQFADWLVRSKMAWKDCGADLRRFEQLGMILRREGDGRSTVYGRVDSNPLWDVFRATDRALRRVDERHEWTELSCEDREKIVADLVKIHEYTGAVVA